MQVHEANIAELYRMCNSPAMNSHAYAFGMDRKAILQRLIEDRYAGNQADFARAIKRAPALVNQWMKGLRKIGDASVYNIEKTCGLGINGFDNYPVRGTSGPPTVNEKTPIPYKYGDILDDFALLPGGFFGSGYSAAIAL